VASLLSNGCADALKDDVCSLGAARLSIRSANVTISDLLVNRRSDSVNVGSKKFVAALLAGLVADISAVFRWWGLK
jgi:hypothetical protein